jgi:hypothetical protein
MNPEHVALINTIAFILDRVGSWPVGTLAFVIVIGPWVLAFLLTRSQEKRFSAVRHMYENNVQLVKSFQSVADNLQDLVIMNTQAMDGVSSAVKNNLFCPLVRSRIRTADISEEKKEEHEQ